MKVCKIIFVIATLFLSCTGYCQKDTIYFDRQHEKTVFDYATYFWVAERQPDGLYKVEQHSMKNFSIQMTGFYKSIEPPVKEGRFVLIDDLGNKSEGLYRKDERVGDWTFYYGQTQSIWYTEKFKDGKPQEITSYYKDGKLKRQEKDRRNFPPEGKCFDEQGNEIPFTPFWGGGAPQKPTYDYQEFLSKHIVYPENAKNANIQGKVLVKFLIDTDGSINQVEVVKHVYPSLDSEAIRVVSMFPNWNPAYVDDKPAKVYFTLPIVFNLR